MKGLSPYDEGQHIILFNEVAEKIFGIPIWKAKMMTLSECFSEISLTVENPEDLCDDVQSINHTDYIVNAYPLYIEGHYSGGVIRYKEFSAIRRLEKDPPKQQRQRVYRQKTALMISLEKPGLAAMPEFGGKRWLKGMEPSLLKGRAASGKKFLRRPSITPLFAMNPPFIAFNCASIPDTLIESELFGYEEGRLPEPVRAEAQAFLNWPTEGLFLDELGDISPNMQTNCSGSSKRRRSCG